jgi:hypothetical protein
MYSLAKLKQRDCCAGDGSYRNFVAKTTNLITENPPSITGTRHRQAQAQGTDRHRHRQAQGTGTRYQGVKNITLMNNDDG